MPLISATEYNNVRQLIAQRVGNFTIWGEYGIPTSTTSSGYGRNFTSDNVVGGNTPGVSDVVTEEQYFNLWLDLQSAYVHQTGTVNAAIDPTEFEGKTTYPNDVDVNLRDAVAAAHITDLTTIANDVLAFNHAATDFPSSSFTTDLLRTSGGVSLTSIRSTSWGGSGDPVSQINHQVTVDFGTHNNLLYFLSAGGEIRFDASLTGGTSSTSNTKDWDWALTLSEAGTIRFGRVNNATWRCDSVTGTGTGYSNTTLATSSPGTLIFEKQGGGRTGGNPGTVPVTQIYDDNFYRIFAWTGGSFATATTLVFNIVFLDGDIGTGGQVEGFTPGRIDESVTGVVTSNVYTYTPDSDFVYNSVTYNAIVSPVPAGTINSSL